MRSASVAGRSRFASRAASGERYRAGRIEQHPAREPAALVTRTVDQGSRRARAHPSSSSTRPSPRLVVLPEHVERPYDDRRRTSELETAPSKRQAGRSGGHCAAATRTGSISRPTTRTSARDRDQPRSQLDRRDGCRTKADVDHKRIFRAPERGGAPVGDPRIDAAQPVRVRGATRDHADRPVDASMYGRAVHVVSKTRWTLCCAACASGRITSLSR